MNPWYENLVARCYKEHDLECEQGEDCQNRRGHVERHYVPTALRERVEQAEERIQAMRELHSGVTAHDECEHCRMNTPCPTIRALGGDDWVNTEYREAVPELIAEVKKLKKERDQAYDWADNQSYPLVVRQGEILTGVANALNGPAPALTSWSTHDLAEKAEKLVRSKNFQVGLRYDAEAEVRRLENIIVDLEVYINKVDNGSLDVETIRAIMEET